MANTQKYTKATIIVHWISALFIIGLFVLGTYISGIKSIDKIDLIKIHSSTGTLLFLLTIYRVYLFFTAAQPTPVDTGSKFNNTMIKWIHNSFYVLLLLISVLGILTMQFGGYADAFDNLNPSLIMDKSDLPQLMAHEWLAKITIFLAVLHVVGVIKHWIFKKENTLHRIV